MNVLVLTYVLYLILSIGLGVWVARALSRHGQVFLVDVFRGNQELASAVNHLLVVGFYLIDFGFVAWYLRTDNLVVDARQMFETLSLKVGTVLLVLGALHLGNVWVLSRLRRRARYDNSMATPVERPTWPVAPAVTH